LTSFLAIVKIFSGILLINRLTNKLINYTMPNYKPLNDHVLIKPINGQEVSKAGIILPDTVDKEKPEKGEVVAMGPGKLLENGQRAPMSVKVGDKVIFKKYSPDELPGEKELLLVREEDILAVME
jgi:chaperonin GroES